MKLSLRLTLAATLAAAVPAIAGAATAQENWTNNCAKCHGPDGAGKTPMGKTLKLRDYSDPAVQATFTDEDITKSIKEGRKNEAGKVLMPSAAGKIADEDLPALVAFVRSLKKQG